MEDEEGHVPPSREFYCSVRDPTRLHSFGDRGRQAVSCAKALRRACVSHFMGRSYNDFLARVKSKHDAGGRSSLWETVSRSPATPCWCAQPSTREAKQAVAILRQEGFHAPAAPVERPLRVRLEVIAHRRSFRAP